MNEIRQQVAFPSFGPARNGERGMTLIEVLVALGILAAVAGVFLLDMSTSSKAVMISQERVAFDSLAKSQMEDIKAQLYDGTGAYSKIVIPQDLLDQGYDIDWPFDVQELFSGLQEITVTVTHDEKVFTLVGYKVKP